MEKKKNSTGTYLKKKIMVQKQVELCEIPIFGGVKRWKSGAYTKTPE